MHYVHKLDTSFLYDCPSPTRSVSWLRKALPQHGATVREELEVAGVEEREDGCALAARVDGRRPQHVVAAVGAKLSMSASCLPSMLLNAKSAPCRVERLHWWELVCECCGVAFCSLGFLKLATVLGTLFYFTYNVGACLLGA